MDELRIERITRKAGVNTFHLTDGTQASLPHAMFKECPYHLGASFDREKFEAWKRENEFSYAYNSALYSLSLQQRTVQELRRLLLSKAYTADAAERVLVRLSEAGLLQDQEYAENFTQSRALRGQGKFRIAAALRQKGIDSDILSSALDTQNPEIFRQGALLAARRASRNRDLSSPRDRAAVKAALVRKGFSFEQAEEAIEALRAEKDT